MQLINKAQIANAFGRAATRYDEVASLQRGIADRLVQAILASSISGDLLDAGCGTGYIGQQLKSHGHFEITALDLSVQMLQQAKYNDSAHQFVQGDIELLPFEDQQFDSVVSSLAVQWCHSFERAIHELLRVLKPGGRLYLSTLVDPTLHELKTAWQAIDDQQHVINFVLPEDVNGTLQKISNDSSIQSVNCEFYSEKLVFRDIFAVLKSLQGIGATALPNRRSGLLGKGQLLSLSNAYPNANGVEFTLSYEVAELMIIKEKSR